MKKKIQKPFNVEDAKNGAVIKTKNGHSVRIICYDKVADDYPIVALVNIGGIESCYGYTTEGRLFRNEINKLDLVIVEEVEETKFKEGDWVINMFGGGQPWLITAVTSDCYELQNTQCYKIGNAQLIIDNYYRLWTLNDAKPGDILVIKSNKHPFIYKGNTDVNHPSCPVAYCGMDNGGDLQNYRYLGDFWWTNENIEPATKEQRDLLFKKIEEAGYSWDAKSFTLSKIQKKWRDNEKNTISGYYIGVDSSIIYSEDHSNTKENYNLFASEKQAKSALAIARISQIMANDERFGGVVTDEEWRDVHSKKFVIKRVTDGALLDTAGLAYNFLAFHTKEQAELFLKENKDLVKDYYMLD